MKTIGIMVVVAGIVVGAVLLLPILEQRPHWPTPREPNQILAECAVISDTAPTGEYPKERWGPAIRALNPRFVLFEDEGINIILSTGGIGDNWGFMVYPDLRTNGPSGVAESRMIVPGIFRYK